MSKASKDKAVKSMSPGPGAYEAKDKKRGPTYVMSGRNIHSKVEVLPGPGQYNAEKVSKRPAGLKIMPQTARPTTAGPSINYGGVGPGAYEQRGTKKATGGKFTQAERKDIMSSPTKSNPGPGSYQRAEEKMPVTTPSFSYQLSMNLYRFGSKCNGVKGSLSPGPGSYEIPDTAKTAAPGWRYVTHR